MTKRHITIATRESPLALQQSAIVKAMLLNHHPQLSIDFLGITTEADSRLDVTLDKIGGKGLFVKELEEALYDGRADIAVHSMKDVPMMLPQGLIIPVMCEREEPRDAFVSNRYRSLAEMPQGARLGTSSLRRQSQMRALRQDITLQNLRGNIQTRLKRMDEGDYDAIILAGAGLKRMQMADRIRTYLSTEESLPAAGQGILGIECREEDSAIIDLIMPLNHPESHQCATAERAVLSHLGGNCITPIAAFAEHRAGLLTLRGLVATLDGMRILRAQGEGSPKQAASIGKRIAEELLQQGAEKILRAFSA